MFDSTSRSCLVGEWWNWHTQRIESLQYIPEQEPWISGNILLLAIMYQVCFINAISLNTEPHCSAIDSKMCRLNLRDYLARPKQHSSGDGSSSLSSSPLLSFSPPLHTSPQQVLISSFCWHPWLAQACWSMLPKSACRRSPPRSLLPRSNLNPTTMFDTGPLPAPQ